MPSSSIIGTDFRWGLCESGRVYAAMGRVTLTRCLPNRVKIKDIYLKEYEIVPAQFTGLDQYFTFYNQDRPYQSLDNRVPAEVFGNG